MAKFTGGGIYSATKAAINTVSPGAIITPGMVKMGISQGMGQTPEEVETVMGQMMVNTTPFKRMGRVEEIADVVVFLASPLASYIHGANIRVDGGYVSTTN
jgi:3-oxoacyl-[acyl-carrier protein] reductase